MEGFVSSIPGRDSGTPRVVKGIWGGSRSFLIHIVLIVLVALFMRFYVHGHPFLLNHTLALQQADGTSTYERVFPPVQRDITTIISILASTTRAASTIWIAGIDLRCIFLFMKRGGITFEGLQSMFGRSLPGRRHFQWKTNFIILALLHGGIFASTYTSSILAGSVTWKASSLYRPGRPITRIPYGQTGDAVAYPGDVRLIDLFVGYSLAIYSVFYGDAEGRDSPSMHRLLPDSIRSLPVGSTFDNLTVPYFAVDGFEWITNPNSTLSERQLANVGVYNNSGPSAMNLLKWGLIPDGNWGPSEFSFPQPGTVSESRILAIWAGIPIQSVCPLISPNMISIPPDIQSYVTSIYATPACFIFANVTYRAGAALCRRCQMSGPGVIRDVGDVKDLQLVDDSVTRAALAIAPYVSTPLFQIGHALPFSPAYPTLDKASIELLSRSYQVAWNGLTTRFGQNAFQSSNVSIALQASTAYVLMWRVALWGTLHGVLLVLGFAFRHLHTRGRYPWIEDPVTAALLVDPAPLINDPRTWAGRDAPHFAGELRLEENGTSTYVVLKGEN